MALAASGDGAAIVPSHGSIPRNGVKALPVTFRGKPIGRWIQAAWDRRRFFPPFAHHFVDELVAHVLRNYPGRDILRSAPPLRRPKLRE
jgi:DNA-binding transcriptional LysR family regulator